MSPQAARFDSLQAEKCITHFDLLSDLDDLSGSFAVAEGGEVVTARGKFTKHGFICDDFECCCATCQISIVPDQAFALKRHNARLSSGSG